MAPTASRADLLLADAKMAGQEAQVGHLEGVLTALREKIDEMDAAYKTELERIKSRNKAEMERLAYHHGMEVESLQRRLGLGRETNNELSRELELALYSISNIKSIIASNGHKRPSKGILAAIREALGMPLLEKPEKGTAPAEKGEGAGD